MIETLHTHPSCRVQESEYRRMLGYPAGSEPSERARELIASTREWFSHYARPWRYMREVEIEVSSEGCRVDGSLLTSPKLRRYFEKARVRRGFLVAAGAGHASVDHATMHWHAGRPDEYFFTEVYGSAVVEHLLTEADGRICAHAAGEDLFAIPHYSPGFDGWDIAEQAQLFEALVKCMSWQLPEPVEVLESGMLRPRKTILGLVGLAPRTVGNLGNPHLVPCRGCSHASCSFRLLPYQYAPAVTERVANDPSDPDNGPPPASIPALTMGASYSVATRALEKWSHERVRIDEQPDGSLRAHFRFDGSTCSNLGHPLAFNYTVELSPPADGYRILSADCRPAADDTGHTRMCAYLTDAEGLMRKIADAPPVLGQPLDAILQWHRERRHTGCYCDRGSRAHKWGLALETIHFTLVQRLAKSAPSAHTPSSLSPPRR